VGRHLHSGFTLVEIVISLFIFAVLSVMAWQGLYQIVQVEERSREQSVEQNELSRAWAILVQDLLHLRSRAVRNSFGDLEAAYTTSIQPYEVIFSRGGLPTITDIIPVGMQRVAYLITEDQELVRRTWPLLDGYETEQGRDQVILQQVESIQFEQLDSGNFFQPNWPPINEEVGPRQVPRMLRVTLSTQSGDEMQRVFAGIQTFSRPGRSGEDGEGAEQ